MFLNDMKLFVRIVLKNRLFTFINVMGLAVGLASCCLVALYIRHELSYEATFDEGFRTYRVSVDMHEPDGNVTSIAAIPAPVADLLKQNFVGIAEVARLRQVPALMGTDGKSFLEPGTRWVDPAFFRIFPVKWLSGNAETALTTPASVVLTEDIAHKYFGNENPLGRSLAMNNDISLQVTGVVENLPTNTHLSGDIFLSMLIWDQAEPEAEKPRPWANFDYHTYVTLIPGVEVESLNAGLPAFVARYFPEMPDKPSLHLDDIRSLHFQSKLGDLKETGDPLLLVVFGLIGFAILAVAIINFINLSTARAALRGIEVGLRKTVGACRGQLIRQFMGESLVLTSFAALLALVLVEVMLPQLEAFLGLQLKLSLTDQPLLVAGAAGTVLLVVLVAGWYPAFFLSSFNVTQAIRSNGGKGLVLRNLLVVTQFAIAIVLIVVSVTIYSQMQLLRSLDMGFDYDNRLVIRTSQDYGSAARAEVLRGALLQVPGVVGVTRSSSSPLRNEFGIYTFIGSEGQAATRRFGLMPVDFDYFNVYGIDLIAGRSFDRSMQADLMPAPADGVVSSGGAFVLSTGGAREFGWTPEAAVGKSLVRDGHSYPVIGVVADTIESGSTGSNPMLYTVPADLDPGNFLTVELAAGNPEQDLAGINAAWRSVNPDEPIYARFMDEKVAELYLDEAKRQQLSYWFSTIAIIISSMGLYGLAAYSAENRRREIGVRKVLGGSVWQIVYLLTSDFSRLVLLANLIAWPVAYFEMEHWLENFAYRIDLTPLVFIGSGMIAFCIAWVTVGSTAANAASQKPVLALRYE